MTAAKAKVAAWNQTIATFQVGIAKSGENLGTLGKKLTLDQLKTLASNVGTNIVAYTDAEGRTQTNKVSHILEGAVQETIAVLTGKVETATDSRGKSLFPDAPGIGLVMANLSLDMAQAKKENAELQFSQLTARAHLFERVLGNSVQIPLAAA